MRFARTALILGPLALCLATACGESGSGDDRCRGPLSDYCSTYGCPSWDESVAAAEAVCLGNHYPHAETGRSGEFRYTKRSTGAFADFFT